MKKELLETINEIINLLEICNLDEKVEWFRIKHNTLNKLGENTKEFKEELLSIKKIIAGMGSFTDLSLTPKVDSGITRKEAKIRQWDLAEQLDKIIINLLSDKI